MLREKARFFTTDTVYKTLSGSDVYQFSNADTGYWIFITATEACTVLRCGKNLMYPVSNASQTITKETTIPAMIMRPYSANIYRKILKQPRTYSFKVSQNSITKDFLLFQENTMEYSTGLLRVNPNQLGVRSVYISDTASTYTNSYMTGSFYLSKNTTANGDSAVISDFMCAFGNDSDYEPYCGKTLSLKAGETVAVSALDGINTIIGSTGALTVQYVEKKTTEGNT